MSEPAPRLSSAAPSSRPLPLPPTPCPLQPGFFACLPGVGGAALAGSRRAPARGFAGQRAGLPAQARLVGKPRGGPGSRCLGCFPPPGTFPASPAPAAPRLLSAEPAMDPPASTAPYARLQLPDLDSVPSYKYWAICNILCCCLPLGLVAVYYSGQVEECLARRDIAGAKAASDTARTINILAVVVGLACIGATIFFMIQRAELIKAAQPTQFPFYNLG
ncbi:unnamed protein product [Natator depressus]